MADEIRIQPKNPEAARAEIERTRARMSETIDEIEDVLLQKRERLKEQLDIGARIREKPLQAAGIAVGVGLLLGCLTGGGKKEPRRDFDSEERAALWEARARRLLDIARAQEEAIEELETVAVEYAALPPYSEDDDDEDDWDDDLDEDEIDEGPSRLAELRDTLLERLGPHLSAAADRVSNEWHRRF
jgi:hypothetical protein